MSNIRTRTKAQTAYIYNNKFLGKQITLLFSINAPSELRLVRSSTATVPVTILRANTFSNVVELTVQGAAAGVSASVNSAATTGTNSQLTVTVGNVANGNHNLTLRVASDAISKTDTVLLKVKDFLISLATSAATLVAGSPAVEIAVTIERSPGFNQSVALAVEGLPQSTQPGAGVSATFEPSSTFGSTSTLRLKAGRFAPLTSFALTLRGTSGNLVDTVALGVEVVGSESP